MRVRSPILTVTLGLLTTLGHAQTPVTCHIKMFKAPSGSTLTLQSGMGINRYGTIVGWASRAQGFVRYSDGSIRNLGIKIAGYPNVFPMKRNAAGDTVGFVFPSGSGGSRGFIRSGSTTKLFTVPGFTIAGLAGINRYKTLVGNLRSTGSEVVNNGFFYKNGQLRKLPIPVAHRVWSISDTGAIVGSYVNSTNPQPFDNVHGFVFANGQFRDLSAPWAGTTFATDISPGGMIVGVTEGPGGSFIYRNGKFYRPKFLLPNGSTVSAQLFGVNGSGQITGQAGSGQTSGPFIGSCSF